MRGNSCAATASFTAVAPPIRAVLHRCRSADSCCGVPPSQRTRRTRRSPSSSDGTRQPFCVRPYLVENTVSRPICEVKQPQARLVLRSVMTREPRVSYAYFRSCETRLATPKMGGRNAKAAAHGCSKYLFSLFFRSPSGDFKNSWKQCFQKASRTNKVQKL